MESKDLSKLQLSQEQFDNLKVGLQNIEKLKAMIEEEEKKIEPLKNILLTSMKDNNVDKYLGNGLTISYMKSYTKTMFDSKKFKEDKPEIAELYMKSSTIDGQVRFKLGKEKE